MKKASLLSNIFLPFSILLYLYGCAVPMSKKACLPIDKEIADEKTHLNEGLTLVNKRAFKKALEFFTLAAKVDPSKPEPYFYKGISLFRMDKYEEAVIAFDKTLKVSPDY
jgi:tetratricopeptide (TPR) repeat protein